MALRRPPPPPARARPGAASALGPSARPGAPPPSRPRRPLRLAPPAAAAATAPAAAPAASLESLIPRGETSGAVLVVDGVSVQAGERDLMTDVDWRVMPGQRVGLTGANGAPAARREGAGGRARGPPARPHHRLTTGHAAPRFLSAAVGALTGTPPPPSRRPSQARASPRC